MPRYDYRCLDCDYTWEAEHSIDQSERDCPECESTHIQKRLTSAPSYAKGIETHAGDGKRASAEQLRAKWAEETPKLRKKLIAKHGEKAVNALPTLNHHYDAD